MSRRYEVYFKGEYLGNKKHRQLIEDLYQELYDEYSISMYEDDCDKLEYSYISLQDRSYIYDKIDDIESQLNDINISQEYILGYYKIIRVR